nr:retrovirus-related Pol polyprotein from transposon TNT 1-94 [Tanacetum cinerariifolium]
QRNYLWDALERQMRGSEYGEQDRKAAILYEYETFKAIERERLLDAYLCYLQQNQGDVNDALGYKKKTVMDHLDPLALVAEKTNVSKQKEKVIVSSDSEGSGSDDFSELKKITALLAKAFNRRNFYSKPTNNNLRTSSTSQSDNKKQEFVKTDNKKVEKNDDEKKRHMSRVNCYNCKKEGHFAKDCKKVKYTPSGYKWKPKSEKENVNPNVSLPLGNASRTANVMDTMTSRRSTVSNTPLSSNSFAARRDYPIHRAVTIKRVYYVEGLNHNLFSVGQFCDTDLEVAFQKSTCFIRDLKGNDLLTGSRGTNLYSITLQDTNCPNVIFLMAKATSSQAWLWHRSLSHLNFNTINLLSKNDIVVGLPKLKFVKDHLCSSCELGKAKRKSFHTKLTPSSKRRLQLLHMDLCGPMRVASINGKIYVLVIVDDYSRYTWTQFLRSKDETPKVLIDFLRLVQRELQAQVRVVRTDKGTEFLNQTLHAYFAAKGILHQTFVARTPEQNGIVKRQNRTLVEAARTMLSAAKVPLFLWAEAIATACFTQNRYSTQSRAYRVFNKRTRVIMETIHVNFDELPQMASDHSSSDPAPEYRTVTTSNELDLLFSLMFDELLNGSPKVVSKSFAVSTADAPYQRQNHTTPLNIHTTHAPTCQVLTLAPTVISSENINQAETYAENDQVADDEFINIFYTPVQDQGETSSRHEELHQFDRLDVWELVDRPLCTNVINLKWLWKEKRDEENTVIRNNSRLVAKGYAQKEGMDVKTEFLYGPLKEEVIGTPMATKHLDADLSGTLVDQTKYRSKVEALMYLTASRPDIMHATCYCARYQAQPTEKHLTAVKRIFRYLKDTIHMGLWYSKDIGFELTSFSDSDHAGCLDSRKSTSGGIQSKKQDCTLMSSVEAEYVSLSTCCTQVLWMRTQLTDYGFHFDKIPMYYDSKAAIAISCNSIQHSRTKHIDVRYHFIKEKVEKGIIELVFVGTEYQLADLFTKALPVEKFKYLVRRLGMRCLTPAELEALANESA